MLRRARTVARPGRFDLAPRRRGDERLGGGQAAQVIVEVDVADGRLEMAEQRVARIARLQVEDQRQRIVEALSYQR